MQLFLNGKDGAYLVLADHLFAGHKALWLDAGQRNPSASAMILLAIGLRATGGDWTNVAGFDEAPAQRIGDPIDELDAYGSLLPALKIARRLGSEPLRVASEHLFPLLGLDETTKGN